MWTELCILVQGSLLKMMSLDLKCFFQDDKSKDIFRILQLKKKYLLEKMFIRRYVVM